MFILYKSCVSNFINTNKTDVKCTLLSIDSNEYECRLIFTYAVKPKSFSGVQIRLWNIVPSMKVFCKNEYCTAYETINWVFRPITTFLSRIIKTNLVKCSMFATWNKSTQLSSIIIWLWMGIVLNYTKLAIKFSEISSFVWVWNLYIRFSRYMWISDQSQVYNVNSLSW